MGGSVADTETSTGRSLHVEVDGRKCQGHNRCIALCPEVFEADEFGYSVVKRPEIGPELEGKARLAEQNCPEDAITVT
jgi:ferredoxin